MILSIDHIQLAMPVNAEEKARAFYTGILGFTEIQKPAALANRGGAWFETGEVRLHFGVDHDFHAARKAHPAFIVDDLDLLLKKIHDAGYEIDSSQPELEGLKRAHIYDPFGNRIELMERLPRHPTGSSQ